MDDGVQVISSLTSSSSTTTSGHDSCIDLSFLNNNLGLPEQLLSLEGAQSGHTMTNDVGAALGIHSNGIHASNGLSMASVTVPSPSNGHANGSTGHTESEMGQPLEVEAEEEASEVDIEISNVVCNFKTRCHLHLRQIAMKGSNVVFKREMGVSFTWDYDDATHTD